MEPARGGGKLSYFDCVKTPMTSAYKSAMMCTLPVLGPQYLQVKNGEEFVNSGENNRWLDHQNIYIYVVVFLNATTKYVC